MGAELAVGLIILIFATAGALIGVILELFR